MLRLLGLCLFLMAVTVKAESPPSVLETLQSHPYMPPVAVGHASQNFASPKYFRPGYGYVVREGRVFGKTDPLKSYYFSKYRVGNRIGRATEGGYYRPPWYLPGSPAGLTVAWPRW